MAMDTKIRHLSFFYSVSSNIPGPFQHFSSRLFARAVFPYPQKFETTSFSHYYRKVARAVPNHAQITKRAYFF